MLGQLLAGHYRVLQVLGAGGFGQTYITEDLHLPGNPKCVLKHLKPASTDKSLLELARKLFDKEAIVLQKLGNHDRIPRLLAYFEENQEFYLVQQYIPGNPLSAELPQGKRWQESQVITLLEEILEILIFIHAQGVIHRDIKPDNIMRREQDRRLVLIDFGAIKQVRNQQMLHGQNTMTVAIGTPGYMPLEQASGTPRASSDIYALGKIAIQALTGANPYDLAEDDRTGELKWEHLTAANPQLIAVLQRMTRYHFKDRYHTAEEALRAVTALTGATFPEVATQVQQTKAWQVPSRPSLESQRTVPAYPPTYPSPVNSTPSPAPVPRQSNFPIIAGVTAIAAAVGSFTIFSTNILNRRSFATDIQSDLCRIATPTDLPSTRVRSQPQRDAQIIASVPRGTKVVYLEATDAFVKIQLANNSTGWVYNNQIRGCNEPILAPTPKPTPAITQPKPTPADSPKPRPQPSKTPVTPKPIRIPDPTPLPSMEPIEVPPPINPEPAPDPVEPSPDNSGTNNPKPERAKPDPSKPPSNNGEPTPSPEPSVPPLW